MQSLILRTFIESPDHAFNHTILMWYSLNCLFHTNLFYNTKFFELIEFIFPTIFRSQVFDFQFYFFLRQSFLYPENSKSIRFMFYEINPYLFLPCRVIDEGHVIEKHPRDVMGANRHRSLYTNSIFLLLQIPTSFSKAKKLILFCFRNTQFSHK